MTDEAIEAAALIDLTDQVQDDAEAVGSNVRGGGCLTVAVLILAAIWLAKILS